MTLNKEELLRYKTGTSVTIIYSRINDFMDYVYQNDLYEYTDDIYDDNGIKEILENELEKSGWERVFYMLRNVEYAKCDYLIKDNYGNFNNITNVDINNIIDNIVYDLDKSNKEGYEL